MRYALPTMCYLGAGSLNSPRTALLHQFCSILPYSRLKQCIAELGRKVKRMESAHVFLDICGLSHDTLSAIFSAGDDGTNKSQNSAPRTLFLSSLATQLPRLQQLVRSPTYFPHNTNTSPRPLAPSVSARSNFSPVRRPQPFP